MTDSSSVPLMSTAKYKKDGDFRKILNKSLNIFFKDAVRVAVTNPAQALYFLKTVRLQRKAANIRKKWQQQGVHVPPIMIFSITNRCNLHCKGCYHWALHDSGQVEMSIEKIRSTIAEAKELGIYFMVLAGGEPLVRQEMLDIIKDFPEIIFLVFTNGLLINEEIMNKLNGQRNFVPSISLEGYELDTDLRRGEGVYRRLEGIVKNLKKLGFFWSVSLTVTKGNFDTITSNKFIKDLVDLGCKLFFFVEFTPITEDTEDWIISEGQRERLLSIRNSFRLKFPALFIAVPGDEEEIGGCLSAGKGFVHISAEGNVEPCPFAPYSDTNLKELSLKDALQSEFLKAIRDKHGHLSEVEGGCALWVEREWVRSLIKNK